MGIREGRPVRDKTQALDRAGQIDELLAALRAEASVEVEIEAPFREEGLWWLQLEIDGAALDVSWQSVSGFGLYLSSPEFGGRPDEICNEAGRCARRLLQLAAAGRVGAKDHVPTLKDVRHLYGVSQVELAAALGTDQAHVSRLERRADLKVSTIRDYVSALGGELELTVRFPDYSAAISPAPQREAVDAA
jgi:hypothetical protein